jgi:predicted molibdopterin-dependent oxidoreductase YjgC
MRQMIALRINGAPVTVPTGTTVAVAVLSSGVKRFRRAVHGEPRAALCGMGICFECRVAIDGKAHARSCQVVCAEGMEVHCDD